MIADLALVGLLGNRHAVAQGRTTTPLSIRDVQNFNYFIAPGFDGAPRGDEIYRAASSEKYDLLIANYYAGHNLTEAEAVRGFQNSSPRGRLAIAYINAGEFLRCCSNIDRAQQDRWFDATDELTSAAPGWLGPRNPKFKNLCSVREWDPAWQAYLLGEIDKIIALGFDGVFLDVLYSDGTWGSKGFAAGQAGVADYRDSQTSFAKAIWDHVRNGVGKSRFVIITNYSGVLDDNLPAMTEGLRYSDAFMKESEYFGRDDKRAPWVGTRPIEDISQRGTPSSTRGCDDWAKWS